MKIVSSLKCTEYESIGHPESPQRVKETYNFLKKKGYEFIEPKFCSEDDILLVHSKGLLESVKNGTFFDADTPNINGIFNYARLSVGAAIEAAKIVKEERRAFSLMRPPGHHATKDSIGGFCYFNNIAIAVKKSLADFKRIAILDIDVHHGNGTEDIFLGENNVLYVSLHQSQLYPGTGLTSRNNCLNFPLVAYTKEKEYLALLKEALGKIRDFKPEMLAISAGFDTFSEDPLASINLEIKSYYKIAKLIFDLNLPTFVVLEGGYSQKLAECVYEFLKGLEPGG